MGQNLARLFVDPFLGAYDRFSGAIPTLAAALLLLLVGMFLARGVRALIEVAGGRLAIDSYTSRVGINEVLARLGLGKSPTFILAWVAHWFILFLFIVSAANAVNMTVVSEMLERFVQVLPSMVAAVLILFGGLLFGRLVAHILQNAALANSIRGGAAVAVAAQTVAVGAAGVIALEQIGVRPQILIPTVQILIGSIGLALAIALGLGAKDLAGEYLRELLRPGK
ncbi:MAG: hypothetical protein M0D55_04825 [Elusimicrobiota bacterium]|nr:MAG: hypothetical protein M0D55_04825 [Elusimicrobiota bacterium]